MEENSPGQSRLRQAVSRLTARVRRSPSAAVLCGILVLIMLGLFLYWLRREPDRSAAGRAAALLSALLFTGAGLRFIPRWMEEWTGPATAPRPAEAIRPRQLLAVFFSLLALDAAILLFVYLLNLIRNGTSHFLDALSFWTCVDSQHYLAIAEDWYLSEGSLDRLVQLVFLPGYPLVIRLFYPLLRDYLYTGLLVSGLAFAGAGTMLYRLARLDTDHAAALRAVRYACLLPGVFFYAAPMSESLFLLLCLSCVYLLRRKRWLPACLLGGMAAFTRSLGIVLLVPAGYMLLTELIRAGKGRDGAFRWVLRFLPLLLIPAGFGAYCLICKDVSGDPFQWMIYQREHWHQQLGLFFHTACYQTENAVSCFRDRDFPLAMGIWVPNLLCAFGALLAAGASVRRLPAAYTAYFLAYFFIAIGATWLLSAPRYLLTLFPVPLGLACLTEDRRADALLTVILTALSVLYTVLFVLRWQVW